MVEDSITQEAGLVTGDVLVAVNGNSLSDVPLAQALNLLVAKQTARLVIETEATSRQHTTLLGWLPSRFPANFPANFPLVISAADGPCREALVRSPQCSLYRVPILPYGHTDKLSSMFVSELVPTGPRDSAQLTQPVQQIRSGLLKKTFSEIP